jgi:acyl-lipid omega-6 desaturase (Delta-12 desaturase)
MQWFTGNIGLHHIHHLRPGIPNYNLPQCQKDFPEFKQVNPLTFRKSLRSLDLHLWDEDKRKMVGFRSIK